MARPKRCRRVCKHPVFLNFKPSNGDCVSKVQMTVDEYEVIRLVDYEQMTHEQCATQMQISRTTVTEIYDCARKKLADFIINGKFLEIFGGNFHLCEGNNSCSPCKCKNNKKQNVIDKGECIMKIAVTYDNEQIFQHFGHTEKFKIYNVENGQIIGSKIVDTNGQGHGALSTFLKDNDIQALICGGIGGGAQTALSELGIKLYGGVSGSCDKAVEALITGELSYNPNVKCSHHEHEHGGEHHACGDHGCDKDDCHHHN